MHKWENIDEKLEKHERQKKRKTNKEKCTKNVKLRNLKK